MATRKYLPVKGFANLAKTPGRFPERSVAARKLDLTPYSAIKIGRKAGKPPTVPHVLGLLGSWALLLRSIAHRSQFSNVQGLAVCFIQAQLHRANTFSQHPSYSVTWETILC